MRSLELFDPMTFINVNFRQVLSFHLTIAAALVQTCAVTWNVFPLPSLTPYEALMCLYILAIQKSI